MDELDKQVFGILQSSDGSHWFTSNGKGLFAVLIRPLDCRCLLEPVRSRRHTFECQGVTGVVPRRMDSIPLLFAIVLASYADAGECPTVEDATADLPFCEINTLWEIATGEEASSGAVITDLDSDGHDEFVFGESVEDEGGHASQRAVVMIEDYGTPWESRDSLSLGEGGGFTRDLEFDVEQGLLYARCDSSDSLEVIQVTSSGLEWVATKEMPGYPSGCSALALADLDGDGVREPVVFHYDVSKPSKQLSVFDAATGELNPSFDYPHGLVTKMVGAHVRPGAADSLFLLGGNNTHEVSEALALEEFHDSLGFVTHFIDDITGQANSIVAVPDMSGDGVADLALAIQGPEDYVVAVLSFVPSLSIVYRVEVPNSGTDGGVGLCALPDSSTRPSLLLSAQSRWNGPECDRFAPRLFRLIYDEDTDDYYLESQTDQSLGAGVDFPDNLYLTAISSIDLEGDQERELLLGSYLADRDELGSAIHSHGLRAVRLGSPSAVFVRCDANRDETLNLADAVRIFQRLFSPSTPPIAPSDAADCNDDGRVNLSDAFSLLQFEFGSGGSTPPEPFPEAGIDPSADTLTGKF